jgi:hypothetical protein
MALQSLAAPDESKIQAETLAQLLGAAIRRLKELGEKSWELPPYAKRLASAAPSRPAEGKVADPEFEQEAPETRGTWAERCFALYQVVGVLANQLGIFETSQDVCDALDVAAGRDERLSTGALYLEAAERLQKAEAERDASKENHRQASENAHMHYSLGAKWAERARAAEACIASFESALAQARKLLGEARNYLEGLELADRIDSAIESAGEESTKENI